MDVLQVAENIARVVMPDLADQPVYLLPMDQCEAVFPRFGEDCYGAFHLQLCRAMRPQLEAAGSWRGDGIAVAIDLRKLRRHYDSDHHFPRAVAGVVLHEFIHGIWRACQFMPAEDAAAVVQAATVEGNDRAARAASDTVTDSDYWAYIVGYLTSHGPAFTRMACHAAYRTTIHGPFSVAPHYLEFAGAYPGLEEMGDPQEYVDSLQSELHDRRDEALCAIAMSEPPQPFTDLLTASVARLRRRYLKCAA